MTTILNLPALADEEKPVMSIPVISWPSPEPTVVPTATLPPATPTVTLPPAVIHDDPTPTPVPATQPVRLYLAGQSIAVEPSWLEPETLNGATYNRWQVPAENAGHHTDTPAFGETGNVIVGGHSTWYGALKVFAPILGLQIGDTVTGENADGQSYTYRVVSRQDTTYEDNTWLEQPDNKKLLTLYTCNLHLTGLVVIQGELVQ